MFKCILHKHWLKRSLLVTRRSPEQSWRLYVQEPVVCEIATDVRHKLGPEPDVVLHLGPPEVEVPMLHPQLLVDRYGHRSKLCLLTFHK